MNITTRPGETAMPSGCECQCALANSGFNNIVPPAGVYLDVTASVEISNLIVHALQIVGFELQQEHLM